MPPLRARQAAFAGRITVALSGDRLDRFSSASTPRWETLANYAWNVAICEAFYPLLHHVEIVLRNAIDPVIAAAYPPTRVRNVQSWLDSTSSPLTTHAADEVMRARRKLSRKASVNHGDLLAALDFGFWTGLLHKDYLYRGAADRRLWPQLLQRVFPHATGPWDRKFLGRASLGFNEVRKFRNRVFHHEPIWKRPNLAHDRDLILELIRWSSPETSRIVAATNRVTEVLSDDFRRELRVRIYRESRA